MSNIFEIIDKRGKRIHLSKERWTHITSPISPHAYMVNYLEEIKQTLEKPDKILEDDFSESIKYFYKFYKHSKKPKRYLCVAINYLNGEGYVLTAYATKDIKW